MYVTNGFLKVVNLCSVVVIDERHAGKMLTVQTKEWLTIMGSGVSLPSVQVLF